MYGNLLKYEEPNRYLGVDRLLVCLAVFKTVVGGLEPPGWVRFPPLPSYKHIEVGGNEYE